MRPILRRARARANQMDPREKRRINEALRRNRRVEHVLDAAIRSSTGPVLGVGTFTLAVARTLMGHGAEIVDDRATNTQASIFCDLPLGDGMLPGPFALIVSQDGLCGADDALAVADSLVDRLDAGGRLVVAFPRPVDGFDGLIRLAPSVRQRLVGERQPVLLLDRASA